MIAVIPGDADRFGGMLGVLAEVELEGLSVATYLARFDLDASLIAVDDVETSVVPIDPPAADHSGDEVFRKLTKRARHCLSPEDGRSHQECESRLRLLMLGQHFSQLTCHIFHVATIRPCRVQGVTPETSLKSLLFLEKKKQKNFIRLDASGSLCRRRNK